MKQKIKVLKQRKARDTKFSKTNAFTLIELLVVIAIIGILSGLIIITTSNATNIAKDVKAKAELASLNKALMAYAINNTLPISNPSPCIIGDTGANGCGSGFNTTLSNAGITPPPASSGYKYTSNGTNFSLQVVLSASNTYSVDYLNNTTLTCPTNWVDSRHGFCVMQYEANSGTTIGTIDTGGAPRGSITQAGAIAACSALGAGYHLITNTEWTLLARDIEKIGTNWSTGTPGLGTLKMGNNGNSVEYISYALGAIDSAASEATARLCLDSGCTSRLYHFSGNAYEWTNDTCATGIGTGKWCNSDWIEWTVAAVAGYEKQMAGPANALPAVGLGRYYGCSVNGNAFLRGGSWDDKANAGIFFLLLNSAPGGSGPDIGFRCAR